MADKFYAYYNFPTFVRSDWEKLFDIARSYKRAVDTLLQKEINGDNGIYSERNIFPIMTLIHIYFELVLKSLILKGNGVPASTHNLEKLLEKAKKLHKTLDFKEDEAFIHFLNKENPGAQPFRYNFDKFRKEYFTHNHKGVERGIYLSEVWTKYKNIASIVEDYFEKNKEKAVL